MGSPSASLNIPEFMRPWYQSGLQLLFRDSLPEQVLSSSAADSGKTSDAGSAGQQSINRADANQNSHGISHNPKVSRSRKNLGTPTSEPESVPNSSAVKSGMGKNVSGRVQGKPTELRSHTDQKPAVENLRGSKDSRIHKPVVRRPLENRETAPAGIRGNDVSWPDPFNKLAPRVSKNVQILWTYLDLAHDLSGNADPQRRKLFQSLIVHMGLPKGSISFWPCSRLDGDSVIPEPDLFWKGVHHFGVKFVACFGESSQDIILPQAGNSASTLFFEGVQVVTLSEPDFMKTLPNDEHLLLATPLLKLPLF